MQALCPAKITLSLHITGRREDGYHLLDALVVFTEFGDLLSVEPADQLQLDITGEFAHGLNASDNLILQAARAMQEAFNVRKGAALALKKRLPVAAGLGGGSSDAAATMRLLNALWELHLPLEALMPIAQQLGADVPPCLLAQPLRMRGIGEQLEPLSGAPCGHLLLVNPRQPLATPSVFNAYQVADAAFSMPQADPLAFQQATNDLEAAACTLCPEIEAVLKCLNAQKNCRLARLCGSGATCFGWFDNAKDAMQAKAAIMHEKPHYWVQQTALLR